MISSNEYYKLYDYTEIHIDENGYEYIICNNGFHKYVHRIVADYYWSKSKEARYKRLVLTGKEKRLVVHHIDFNKRNNNPLL
jgi:hypothetical protein